MTPAKYATVFPLATKGQAAEQIKQLIKDNERAGKKTRIVKSDRGGEFTGTAFVEHLRAKGIKVEHSPAGTPKSNARIERLHGTLFPMLRAVLHERGLPLNLWPMIIDGIVYTYNRLPCAAIGGKIPFELWTGRPVPTRAANYKGAVSGYGLINPRNLQAILSVSYMRWKFAN
jgi:transposase InsO family protein